MTDLQQMIIQQEGTGPMRNGCFLPYDDATGKPLKSGDVLKGKLTVGYGYNITDNGIDRDLAMMLLNIGLANAMADVHRVCSIYEQLSRPRQLVLISLAYNLGYERLSKFVRFLDALHRQDWDEAADELLDSDAARTDAPSRYTQLADMMRHSTWLWV